MTWGAPVMALGLLITAFSPAPARTAPDRPVYATPRTTVLLADGAVFALPRARADGAAPPPLLVLLHGAGQQPGQMVAAFEDDPDVADAVLLAPKSFGGTWDVVAAAGRRAMEGNSLSSDVLRYTNSRDGDRVMSAIAELGRTVATDPSRRILLGFSDGATFALALGTRRDSPFAAVVALSPGLAVVAARPARNRPVLVMHGRRDRTLPFEFTRGTIVPLLRSSSVAVRFVPFDGGHALPERPLAILAREFPSLSIAAARQSSLH